MLASKTRLTDISLSALDTDLGLALFQPRDHDWMEEGARSARETEPGDRKTHCIRFL